MGRFPPRKQIKILKPAKPVPKEKQESYDAGYSS